MRKFIKISFIILFFVPAFLASAQPKVGMKMVLPKSEYALGEPVELKIYIKNLSSASVSFITCPSLVEGGIDISIIYPDGNKKSYVGIFEESFYPTIEIIISPEEVKYIKFRMLYDRDTISGYVFEKPGKYRISCGASAVINKKLQFFNLSDVYLEVTSPENESDKKIITHLLKKDFVYDIHKSLATKKSVDLLTKIADEYPKSSLAPYCLFALGNYLTTNENKKEQSVKILNKIIEKYSDGGVYEDALYRLASIYNSLKLDKKARNVLIKFINHYPDSALISEKSMLFSYYFYIYDRYFSLSPNNWMFYDTDSTPLPEFTREEIKEMLKSME